MRTSAVLLCGSSSVGLLVVDSRLRKEDSGDHAEALGAALAEEYRGALFHKLGTVHESEAYCALVLRAKVFVVELDHLGSLSYYTTVHHGLIVGSYRCSVVKNDNFGLEIVDRLRLSLPVNHDHALAEVVPLQLLLLGLRLDGEADSLACDSLLDVHSLMVDSFDLHRVKLALLVRSQEERRAWNDRTGK